MCINATRIVLVPKVETLTTMDDFRHISCCNVMYKYISKVIVNRLKGIFSDVIRPAQIVFVPERQISNAILLTQELMHNYHSISSMTRYAWKIDIMKNFDIVS